MGQAPVAESKGDDMGGSSMASRNNSSMADENRRDTSEDKPMVRSPLYTPLPCPPCTVCPHSTALQEDASDALDKLGDGGDGDAKKSMRPTTARRRPPKIKDTTREVTAKDTAPSQKKIEGIMRDGAAEDDVSHLSYHIMSCHIISCHHFGVSCSSTL
jgi:hypothetical protein